MADVTRTAGLRLPRLRTKRSAGRPVRLSSLVGLGFLAAVVLLVLVYPLLPGYDPYSQDVSRALLAPGEQAGGTTFPLGTDQLGRDLLSRLALAGTVAVRLAAGAIVIAVGVGTVLGVVSGYFGGWVDRVVGSVVDIQLSIPRILLLIAAVALFPRNLLVLTLLLGLSSWMPYARVVRAQTATLRNSEFVAAARVAGGSHLWIMLRHLMPNLMGSVVIIGAVDLGEMVMLEAALSFLGLGVLPPDTSWGLMIFEAQTYIYDAPYLVVLPGLCVFLLVAGINFTSRRWTGEDR